MPVASLTHKNTEDLSDLSLTSVYRMHYRGRERGRGEREGREKGEREE
jgi:hypothetical protein